jgi:putative pyruvate formate lyase activating enzyme
VADLSREPIAFSIYQEDDGRVWLSDVPEVALESLTKAFGQEAVDAFIKPSETELAYFASLEVDPRPEPRYLEALKNGQLEAKAKRAKQAAKTAPVPYFMTAINVGDEAVLGRAGIIYFVCRKGCHFCQYREFPEATLDAEGIAERMIALQDGGADTVQWLSPSAYTKVLVQALFIAAKEGLRLPLVHKSEGEDSLVDLELLSGLVDMYLPDAKFTVPSSSERIGLGRGYPERMKRCIREMYRQVGPLRRQARDQILASGGVLVRHLLMPGGLEDARGVLAYVREIAPDLPIHVMTTYQPIQGAVDRDDINRRVSPEEIVTVLHTVAELGLTRAYVR